MTDGHPEWLEKVVWTRNDYPIDIENEEHISGGTNLEPDLTFSPLQYTDLGVYQCKLSNPAGAGTSKQIELDVRFSPKGNPALTVDEKANEHSNCPLTIAVEEQVRFTCQTDGIESNPQISTFSFFTGGEEKKTHNSSIWDPVFSLVTDTGSYACTANNNVGPSSFSNSKEVIVQATGKVEESPHNGTTLHPVYDNETFSLRGIGSGNERKLAWLLDGDEDVIDILFTGTVDDDEYSGDFAFGQTTAHVQEWRWKAPGESATCNNVTRHNGQYEFRVDAQAGGKKTQDSVTFNIQAYYSPIAESDQEVRRGSALNKSAVLEVHTCSNPSHRSYKWTFNGTELRPGIEGDNSSSINITRVQWEDFGEYTCTVSNEINGDQRSTDITIQLFAQSRPEAPQCASAEGLTSQRINVTWMTGFNGGSDQTFTLKSKQEGDSDYTDVAKGIRDPDAKNNPVEITYSVDELDPQTKYYFQIKATNINEEGETESEWTDAEGQTLEQPSAEITSLKIRYGDPAEVKVEYGVSTGSPTRLDLMFTEGTLGDAASYDTECSSTWKPLLNKLPVDSNIYEGETLEPLDSKIMYSFAIQASEYDDVTCVENSEAGGSVTIPAESDAGLIAGSIIGGILAICLIVAVIVFLRNPTLLQKNKKGSGPASQESGFLTPVAGSDEDSNPASAYEDVTGFNNPAVAAETPARGPLPNTPGVKPEDPQYSKVDLKNKQKEIVAQTLGGDKFTIPECKGYVDGDIYCNVDRKGNLIYGNVGKTDNEPVYISVWKHPGTDYIQIPGTFPKHLVYDTIDFLVKFDKEHFHYDSD